MARGPHSHASTHLLQLVERQPVLVALALVLHALQRVLVDGKPLPAVNGMAVAVARGVSARRVGQKGKISACQRLGVVALAYPAATPPKPRTPLHLRPRQHRQRQQPSREQTAKKFLCA